MKILYVIICVVLSLIQAGDCTAGEVVKGRVVKVIDGDSILVRTERSFLEVRLYGVDAPEYGQPYSGAAKNFVKNMTEHKAVLLKPLYKDSYGRTVAIVQTGSSLLNGEIVRQGFAWVYPRYCRKTICEQWSQYEKNARNSRQGLWAAPRPVAPWIYKRHKKK